MSSEPYELRFPFEIGPQRNVTGLETPVLQTIGQYTWELSHAPPYYHVFKISGLASEVHCRNYTSTVKESLIWAQLTGQIPIRTDCVFGDVIYSDTPGGSTQVGGIDCPPYDGIASGNELVFYPQSMRIVHVTGGRASFRLGTPAPRLLRLVAEGIEISSCRVGTLPAAFFTACQLHTAFWYESTSSAKLLTLVLALECMLPEVPSSDEMCRMVDRWSAEVDEASKTASEPDKREYESVRGSLKWLKTRSIKSRMKSFVRGTLTRAGHERAEAEEYAVKVSKVYDSRSKLVHRGHLDAKELSEATHSAKVIVDKVLIAVFRSGC